MRGTGKPANAEEGVMSDSGLTRRALLRRGTDLGAALPFLGNRDRRALHGERTAAVNGGAPDVYGAIGVRPVINARGTFTIISGSTMLPEVRTALDAAARQYVHLDELMDAIGRRLAELTEAEWGMVTSGCAAALTHATAAAVAGGNPDLHVRMPDLRGFAKDEAIIPTHSRNVYDAALRAIGVRIVEVSTMAELEAAIGPRTALVYILAGPEADESPLSLQAIAPVARAKNVPILVDAAAEILTIPNVHLQNGATLVAYSGGKCLRGPQTAGLLLGRKDLVKAAWVHSAPHHGVGRAMKVGKEEAIAMLTAVEMWTKRDHYAEWQRWSGWLDDIAKRVGAIDGVTPTVVQPRGLSNRTPSLRIHWDRERFGMSGDAVARALLEGDPRIALFAIGGDGNPALTGVSVTPYMLAPGEVGIVADQLHAVLTRGPKTPTAAPASPAGDLTGAWEVRIRYAAAEATHTLHLRQRGNDLEGAHLGDFVTRDLTGTIDGSAVRIASRLTEAHGDALFYTFTGTVNGDTMSGSLDMAEYLAASWTATRHVIRQA
jgi:L-seryl-tRNA(Ser) seleniumtransferase